MLNIKKKKVSYISIKKTELIGKTSILKEDWVSLGKGEYLGPLWVG